MKIQDFQVRVCRDQSLSASHRRKFKPWGLPLILFNSWRPRGVAEDLESERWKGSGKWPTDLRAVLTSKQSIHHTDEEHSSRNRVFIYHESTDGYYSKFSRRQTRRSGYGHVCQFRRNSGPEYHSPGASCSVGIVKCHCSISWSFKREWISDFVEFRSRSQRRGRSKYLPLLTRTIALGVRDQGLL